MPKQRLGFTAMPVTTKFRTRGPLAALTVPAAIAAWALAAEAAKAQGGKLPLDVLLASAIKHAREGYTVTRSQARLTVEKLPEMDRADGFKKAFLIDGKVPGVGARLKQTEFAATPSILPVPGLTISIAATSDGKLPAIWSVSAAR